MFKFTSNFPHCLYILQTVNIIREKLIIRERQAEDTAKGTIHSLQLFAKYAVQLFMCQRCFISLCTFAVYRWTPTNLVAFKLEEYFWAFVEIRGFLSLYSSQAWKHCFFPSSCALGFQNDIVFALKMSILCCCKTIFAV